MAMDMNFPHTLLAKETPEHINHHRAFLARSAARQASSPTARALVLSRIAGKSKSLTPRQMLRDRMGYFANRTAQLAGGSFFPAGCFNAEHKGEFDVYHSTSANGKASELSTGDQGNRSKYILSRTL